MHPPIVRPQDQQDTPSHPPILSKLKTRDLLSSYPIPTRKKKISDETSKTSLAHPMNGACVRAQRRGGRGRKGLDLLSLSRDFTRPLAHPFLTASLSVGACLRLWILATTQAKRRSLRQLGETDLYGYLPFRGVMYCQERRARNSLETHVQVRFFFLVLRSYS
ncbi:unnamed protein product [Periconia digitata]|uniref:Uncharacterized protein n=1 Tax=Periconia digitata TaxID=1303443 RepID=A0A9W4UVC4_9PLEO|nr:unnamed protein product [Periconia digitata]